MKIAAIILTALLVSCSGNNVPSNTGTNSGGGAGKPSDVPVGNPK
jgi:hypothetical protein